MSLGVCLYQLQICKKINPWKESTIEIGIAYILLKPFIPVLLFMPYVQNFCSPYCIAQDDFAVVNWNWYLQNGAWPATLQVFIFTNLQFAAIKQFADCISIP